MTLLTWKPEFAVGIESVDYEHREMLGLINEIYEEMKTRRDVASLEQFIGDVHFTISAHFALEERHMRESQYAEYEAHKEDHEELLDQLRSMMDELVTDPEQGFESLQANLMTWFENHFKTFDARLHGHLQVRG